jgi:hypothetical protein
MGSSAGSGVQTSTNTEASKPSDTNYGQIGAGIQAGTSLGSMYGVFAQTSVDKIYTEIEQDRLDFNAQRRREEAERLRELSKEATMRRQLQAKKMIGSQKASLAGQGVQIDGETAEIFEQEEIQITLEDVEAIRGNAWRQAYGLEVDAMNLRFQARAEAVQGYNKARSREVGGLLSGASGIGSALSDYHRSKG